MSPMTSVRITASIIYTEGISRSGRRNIARGGKGCHDESARDVKPVAAAGVYRDREINNKEGMT